MNTRAAPFNPPPQSQALDDLARSAPGGGDLPRAPAERQSTRKSLKPKPLVRGYSMNVPVDLYDELKQFYRDTDMPMSEVMIEGARRELARLKKLHGID